MSDIALSPTPLGSSLLDQVWALYRRNASTLGFLPRGALDEFAHAGCVLAATQGDELLGYVAWRRSGDDAALVHLCVAEDHRGTGCRDVLLHGLIDQCRDLAAIRLRCRKDYVAANNVWPKHGFAYEGEVPGRGADGATLLEWRRRNFENTPLLDAIREATPRAAYRIAMDANVFFDVIDPHAPDHEESNALFADWLDDVEVHVTRELRNEVARQDDDARRKAAAAALRGFKEASAHPDELDAALEAICAVLPPASTNSDHSDRRQLAHAWKGEANFFATRDTTLLDHADDLRALTGLVVLRPSDVIARLQGDFLGGDYAPVRLQGTRIERRPPTSEEELHPFQRFAAGESKADWLRTVRGARATPDRCSVEVIGTRGESPRVAISVDRSSQDALRLRFLRALSGKITGTLLRRIVAEVVESARAWERHRVVIDDPGPGEVRDALAHLGFEVAGDGRLVRYTVSGMFDVSEVTARVAAVLPEIGLPEIVLDAPQALESRLWPLKVLGAGIPTYLIPIRRYWAAALFDRRLADQQLFGVPEGPALAPENVYYSGSKVHIPAGSRILWYVSGEVGEVRAVSVCLGTDTDEATRLSRKYHRLGVFKWQDVLDAAKGDPHKTLRAYHFARTELLERPVPWKRLTALIRMHTNTANPVASPVCVPEALFADVYREGAAESS